MEQAIRELRSIVFQGRETGKPVVVQPADTDAQLSALSQKIDDLQQAITRLTGQLESAGHDVDEARHEADAAARGERRADRPRRRAGAEAGRPAAAAAAPPPAAEAAPPPPPLDAPAALAAAREAYNAGDYDAAETDFKDVVDRFGDTPRGMEARYFLGKLQLKRGAFADAAATDLGVVRQWPAAELGARRGARPCPRHGRHEGGPRGLRGAERDRHPLSEGRRRRCAPASTRCGARRGARRADGDARTARRSCRASIAG